MSLKLRAHFGYFTFWNEPSADDFHREYIFVFRAVTARARGRQAVPKKSEQVSTDPAAGYSKADEFSHAAGYSQAAGYCNDAGKSNEDTGRQPSEYSHVAGNSHAVGYRQPQATEVGFIAMLFKVSQSNILRWIKAQGSHTVHILQLTNFPLV